MAPAVLEVLEHRHVDRDAAVLHARRGPAVASAEERPRHVNPWEHPWQQALECVDVLGAVVEEGLPLVVGERASSYGEVPHRLLFGTVHRR